MVHICVHRSVEENIVVFDDSHVKSPDPLNEIPDHIINEETDKSSQVQVDTGNQVEQDSGMVNHQQTTNIKNTHLTESDNNEQSSFKTENDKQSLGEKSPHNDSDKKSIEPSTEEVQSPVLGLRFTGVISDQSESKVNENADEDGDLLEDHLEYVSILVHKLYNNNVLYFI